MLTANITSIERNQPSADEITIAFDILEDEELVLAERKIALPIESSEDAVRAELSAIVAAFARDLEIAAETALAEEQNAKADALKESLEGQTIS